MVTLQEYKTRKNQETALSDVDFRKVQLLERNPRNTQLSIPTNKINPVGESYLTQGVPSNPSYDISTLDMESRKQDNEEHQATNIINPITGKSYKTKYSFGNYYPVIKTPLLELEEKDYFNNNENLKIEEIFIPLYKFKKISTTTTQDDSYLRLQLTLGVMDAEDKKISPYIIKDARQSIVELLEYYKKVKLPIASINTPAGLELALSAIEIETPEEKIISDLTKIWRNKIEKNKFFSHIITEEDINKIISKF